jgi:tRNA U34 5-carboxymethylaminomethyl modifying enzyme MnmG/GidA
MASKSLEEIAQFIEKMKFRKSLIGGVDEQSVWKKIDDLNNEYKSVFEEQEVKYRTLLEERDLEIKKLKERLNMD